MRAIQSPEPSEVETTSLVASASVDEYSPNAASFEPLRKYIEAQGLSALSNGLDSLSLPIGIAPEEKQAEQDHADGSVLPWCTLLPPMTSQQEELAVVDSIVSRMTRGYVP